MVLWQGLTEGGTAVPVQVTEAGRVVAEGQQGPAGEEGPQGPKGDQGPPGEYGPGDDVDLGSIRAAGPLWAAGWTDNQNDEYAIGCVITDNHPSGIIVGSTKSALNSNTAFTARKSNGTVGCEIGMDGSITAAGNVNAQSGVFDATTAGNGSEYGYVYVNPSKTNGIYVSDSSNTTNITLGYDGSVSFASSACGFTSEGEIYFTSRGTRYKIFVSQGLVQAEPFTREMELRERVEDKRKPRPTDSVPED